MRELCIRAFLERGRVAASRLVTDARRNAVAATLTPYALSQPWLLRPSSCSSPEPFPWAWFTPRASSRSPRTVRLVPPPHSPATDSHAHSSVRVDKEERSHDQDASDARLAKNGARYNTHSFRRVSGRRVGPSRAQHAESLLLLQYFQNGYFVDHNLDNHTFVMPQSIFPPSRRR